MAARRRPHWTLNMKSLTVSWVRQRTNCYLSGSTRRTRRGYLRISKSSANSFSNPDRKESNFPSFSIRSHHSLSYCLSMFCSVNPSKIVGSIPDPSNNVDRSRISRVCFTCSFEYPCLFKLLTFRRKVGDNRSTWGRPACCTDQGGPELLL